MGPVPRPPHDDDEYAEIKYGTIGEELHIFDMVRAQPLFDDPRNVLSLEGVLPMGASDMVSDVRITVWRGVRNGRSPSSAADRLWALINSPDRDGRVPYLPQIIREDQPGYGVLLLEEEEAGGRIDEGVHALVEAIKLLEPRQRRLYGLQKGWSCADINEALEHWY